MVSVTRDTFDALVSHFPGVQSAMQEVMERHLRGRAASVSAQSAECIDSARARRLAKRVDASRNGLVTSSGRQRETARLPPPGGP